MQTICWLTFATVADELNFTPEVNSQDSYTAKDLAVLVKAAYQQPRLFDEPVAKAVQPSLLGDAA